MKMNRDRNMPRKSYRDRFTTKSRNNLPGISISLKIRSENLVEFFNEFKLTAIRYETPNVDFLYAQDIPIHYR